MNKKSKIIILVIFVIIVVIVSVYLFFNKRDDNKLIFTEDVYVVPTMDDVLSSDSSWCSTFQLVWNDMKNELVKQDIVFNPQITMVQNLNKESFTESMLSDEYYFKTYGLKTTKLKKEIEEGIKEKFNQESDILNDISWSDDLSDDYSNYLFYTMLYREFEYNKEFDVLDNGKFDSYDNIKYFGTGKKANSEVRSQLEVLFYDSKDEFAIKVKTKSSDEVIFYKNPTGNTFNKIYDTLNEKTSNYTGNRNFTKADSFKAPMIDFYVKREFSELEGNPFLTKSGDSIVIDKAIQTISFSIDEAGGRVKSEASISTKYASEAEEDKPRYFHLDDTFVLFLKEEEKDIPYLAVRIDDIRKFQQ